MSASKNLPLVSVVIPAYNHADYLDDAINSVLRQTYPNVELIVLNDGSTDGTQEVLEKYTGRFYWETQKNMGQAATLNKGWRMAEGAILGYLSADDLLLPDAVRISVEHLVGDPDVVMTYCDFNLIDSKSRVIRRVSAPEMSYREMIAKFRCLPGPGAFFLRPAYEAAGAWDGELRRIPDHEYWWRLGLQGRFLKIPSVLAALRMHEQSQSFAGDDKRKSEEYVRAMSTFFETQQVPAEVLTVKDEALSNAYIATARSHLTSSRYRRGIASLLEGLRLYPRNAFSARTLRLIGYGLFNQFRYRVMDKVRNTSKGKG